MTKAWSSHLLNSIPTWQDSRFNGKVSGGRSSRCPAGNGLSHDFLKRTKEGLLKMGGFPPGSLEIPNLENTNICRVWTDSFREGISKFREGFVFPTIGKANVFQALLSQGKPRSEKNIGGVVRVLKVHRCVSWATTIRPGLHSDGKKLARKPWDERL